MIIFTRLADWLVYQVLTLPLDHHWSEALHFFIEDLSKIFVLVALMIFLIAFLRAGLDMERVRDVLSGKSRFVGYLLASGFGAITPFCSCSSIPLFLGFTSARIPLGITMAFLITSPMINEVAVVLMAGLLGWRFLVVYVATGMIAGFIGGAFLDRIGAERWLTPLGESVSRRSHSESSTERPKLSFQNRVDFAWNELRTILKRIWIWILVGISIGALIHGFIPEGFLTRHLGDGAWWSVPAAVLLGIPLYGGASATVPIVGTLISRGLPVGTSMAFLMSVVAASIPEFVMLKQVMKTKLLLLFFVMLLVMFTIAGWLFNLIFV